MRDIPMFATEYGVASIAMNAVPYWKKAYITVQSVSQAEVFLQECADFCRVAGAEEIYACGHESLEKYPLHTTILKMCAGKEGLPETEAALFPVQEKTLSQWREIYNQKMKNVPIAAYMTVADSQKMLSDTDGYFVHAGGQLLGIGKAAGDRISAIAAVQPGAGRHVVTALSHGIFSETVTLQVASSNEKAMRLYTQLGFVPVEERSRWYRII